MPPQNMRLLKIGLAALVVSFSFVSISNATSTALNSNTGPMESGVCNAWTIINKGTKYEHKHCINEKRIPSNELTICDIEGKEVSFFENFVRIISGVFNLSENWSNDGFIVNDNFEIQRTGTVGSAIYSPAGSMFESLIGVNSDGGGGDYIKKLDNLQKYINQDETVFSYLDQESFAQFKLNVLDLILNEKFGTIKIKESVFKSDELFDQGLVEAKALNKEAAGIFLKSADIVNLIQQSKEEVLNSNIYFSERYLSD